MKFDDMLSTLNNATMEEFGNEYSSSITDNLFRFNYAICKALYKIEEKRQIVELVNNDVYSVEGISQDELYAQDFVFRKSESKAKGYWITRDSIPGTVIKPYELKLQKENITFANTEKFTIDSNGFAKISVECEQNGKHGNILKNELIEIKTPILGIVSGFNPDKFEGGADRENDSSFRERYLRFRGLYTGLTKDDIQKELYKVSGVSGVQLEENDTQVDKVLDNSLVMPSKTFVCYVDGGADIDIAKALFKKENTSISMLGNVSVNVWSETRKVNETINFFRASKIKIYFRYKIIGDVDIGDVDSSVTSYLMNSGIGSIISSYLAEGVVKKKTDISRLINLEIEFSTDKINFSTVLRLLTGQKIGEVEKIV